MKKASKLLALLLSLAMMAAVVTACGNNDAPASEGGTSEGTTEGGESTPTGEGLVLNVNLASEPHSIDPALNEAVDGAIMIHHLFEGLYGWANDGNGNATMVPAQATGYEKTNNDDGTVTYVFTLRDDIKWSDGEPVTAGDFEYSWKRAVDPDTASTYNYMLDMLVNANEIMDSQLDKEELGVVAVDDQTLEVTLTYDCPYFLEIAAFPTTFPVRQDIIESAGDQWTFDVDTYIGNGPYKMVEWSHNEVIRTVKSETYYDYDQLGPDEINYVLMDDENAMLTSFRSGELDFIESFPVDEIESLLASGEITVADYIGTYFVAFNNEAAPFDDARVREAFTLVIDRDYIVEQVTKAGEQVATGWVPAGIYDKDGATGADFRTTGGDYGFYTASASDEYQANCDRARELLKEAGYENGEGFPVTTYIYNTLDSHKNIAEALQNMWATELGVNVQLDNMDWNAFIEARNNGDFSIARHGWIADYNDPISFLDMWVTGGGNNDPQYSNADYDAAIAAAKSTDDPDERMQHLHEAEDILFGEDNGYGIAPIYFYVTKYMLNDDVQGMYYTPLGYFFFDRCYV